MQLPAPKIHVHQEHFKIQNNQYKSAAEQQVAAGLVGLSVLELSSFQQYQLMLLLGSRVVIPGEKSCYPWGAKLFFLGSKVVIPPPSPTVLK